MEKEIWIGGLIVGIVLVGIFFYFWSITSKEILPSKYCEVDSDCIPYEPRCRYGCWNKNNLPKPVTLPSNVGVCTPPTEISACVCEKNRCQPITSERNELNYYFQSCGNDNDCFTDEICLDSNTLAFNYEYPLKRFDISDRLCYQKCKSDIDCSENMNCVEVKLISNNLWEKLFVSKDWSSYIEELDQAATTTFCDFT